MIARGPSLRTSPTAPAGPLAGPAAPVSLRGLRLAALAFATIDREGPEVLAYAVDVEGWRHELARSSAPTHTPCRHVQLFADLLVRGLRAPHPIVVDVDRCPLLALRVRAAFGPRARIVA
jgi:hypothetical protein